MIKTIKVKKQLRLDELIKYIFDNGIEDKVFPSNGGSIFDMCEARISGSGNIKTSGYINEHTTFTVEVEEQITEDTVFNTLVDVNSNDEVHIAWNDSISLYDKEQTKEIHALVNGKLQLIWEAESDEL